MATLELPALATLYLDRLTGPGGIVGEWRNGIWRPERRELAECCRYVSVTKLYAHMKTLRHLCILYQVTPEEKLDLDLEIDRQKQARRVVAKLTGAHPGSWDDVRPVSRNF